MDAGLTEAISTLAEPETVQLLHAAQLTTFTALKEAEAKLQSLNRQTDGRYVQVQKEIQKKVEMLQEMAENLKHIYMQLNHIEQRLAEMEQEENPSEQ